MQEVQRCRCSGAGRTVEEAQVKQGLAAVCLGI